MDDIDKREPQAKGLDGQPGQTGKTERCDPKMLQLLVCPMSKKRLDYDEARQELISRTAGLAFPIKDGIPIMLVDHARQLDEDI